MIICILENVYANHCHSIFRWPLSKSHVMLMLDLERSILGNNLKSEIKLLQNLTLLPIYHQNQLQCLHYCQNLLQRNHWSQDYEPERARCQGPRTRERQKRNWKMTTINHCCIFSFRAWAYLQVEVANCYKLVNSLLNVTLSLCKAFQSLWVLESLQHVQHLQKSFKKEMNET